MKREVISKKAKKISRQHENFIVFVTPEAKELGWDENTMVRVKVVEEDGEGKILIEKGMEI